MRKMKDSGVEWIGEIPEEWEITKISNLYNLRNEKVNDVEYPPLSVTMKGILPQLETAAKSDAHDDRKLVCKGDFAINSRSDRRGSCGISPYNGSVSLINIVLTPRENILYPNFYNWFFRSSKFADEFYRNGHGIVNDLWTTRWQDMKKISVVRPAIFEQQKIADFLDEKCADIDTAISEAEASIEDYKLLKQSVITQAVTKGLDPNAKMKDSGIKWIGEIPEDWEILKIKYVATCNDETLKENTTDSSFEFDYVDISSVTYGKGITKTQQLTFENAPSRARRIVKNGDIIISTVRTYLKAIAQVEEFETTMIVSTGYAVLRAKSKVKNKYLYYTLTSNVFISDVQARSVGVDYPAINTSELVTLKICVPPEIEQQQIADFLDEKCADINELIAEKQALVEELKAYKKSLIFEYVTGKKEIA